MIVQETPERAFAELRISEQPGASRLVEHQQATAVPSGGHGTAPPTTADASAAETGDRYGQIAWTTRISMIFASHAVSAQEWQGSAACPERVYLWQA